MAVETNILSSKLQLKFNLGTDENGKDIIKSKTYSNIKTDAVDQDVYDSAVILSNLQTNTLEGIHKIQDVVLINV